MAIKVLPEAVLSEPDRVARFEREARVLAALNHANIAGLFGHGGIQRAAFPRHHPMWSSDGKELFYVPGPNQLVVLGVQTRPTFSFGNLVSLPAGRVGSTAPAVPRNRDIDPTGKRFISLVVEMSARPTPVNRMMIDV